MEDRKIWLEILGLPLRDWVALASHLTSDLGFMYKIEINMPTSEIVRGLEIVSVEFLTYWDHPAGIQLKGWLPFLIFVVCSPGERGTRGSALRSHGGGLTNEMGLWRMCQNEKDVTGHLENRGFDFTTLFEWWLSMEVRTQTLDPKNLGWPPCQLLSSCVATRQPALPALDATFIKEG